MKKLMIILAAAIAMSASAIETTIAYQGVLRDAQGNVLTEHAQTITFRLYSQASGGTPLWARAIAVNLDATGLFNVELSDAGTSVEGATYSTLAEALKAARSGALFVGLEVANSSGEISPRQKILMTPYSSWASDVTNASGDFSVAGKATLNSAEISGGLIVNGATTLKGNTTFNNNVTITGGLTVRDTGSFTGYGTIPVGGIIMWSGSTVPNGWALCNGQKSNGVQTPNLCNRFIVGSGIEYNVATWVRRAAQKKSRSPRARCQGTATSTPVTTNSGLFPTAGMISGLKRKWAVMMPPARRVAVPESTRRLELAVTSRTRTVRPTTRSRSSCG